jgi:hypothetical protein
LFRKNPRLLVWVPFSFKKQKTKGCGWLTNFSVLRKMMQLLFKLWTMILIVR